MAATFPNPFELGQANFGLSPLVWRGIDTSKSHWSAHRGFVFNKWTSPVGDLTATQATAGTAAYLDTIDGFGTVLEVDCNSATNGQGINIQDKNYKVNAKNGMVVAIEWMIRALDIATGPEAFAGLSDVDTTIIASDAYTTGYKVGIGTLTAGTLKCVAGDNAVPTATAAAVHTLVDGDTTTDGTEWVRCAARGEVGSKLQFYINGLQVASELAASLFPIGAAICPSIVCQSNGTTDPIIHAAWYAFGYDYL